MVKRGQPPYLECSSKGDKRFSAFYAHILWDNRPGTIEHHYQGLKVFSDGTTGWHWRKAKGRQAVNASWCAIQYTMMWEKYIHQHPKLLDVLKNASGLSDVFGREGGVCQATVLWDIRNGLQIRFKEPEGSWRGCCKACLPKRFPRETMHICGKENIPLIVPTGDPYEV